MAALGVQSHHQADVFVREGAHERLESWLGKADRSELCFRRTDAHVKGTTGRWPLSVSADKLGVVAMRCALLQERFAAEVWDGERQPRGGTGRLVETYPAAALRVWGLPGDGYKGKEPERRAVRRVIVDGLQELPDLGELEAHSIASDEKLAWTDEKLAQDLGLQAEDIRRAQHLLTACRRSSAARPGWGLDGGR